jgi:hypothetical protein
VGTALVVALAATATATAAPAAAQSERHPRPPVDAEAEAEARSEFWEEVVRPGARRYQHLVDAATDILRMRVGDFTWGTVWMIDTIPGTRRKRELSRPPASSRRTRAPPCSARRRATMQPALPAPTTM